MELVRFDEKSRNFLPFEVAQTNDRWSIPSHSDYPADAKGQLAEAATSLMGLKVVGMAPGMGGDKDSPVQKEKGLDQKSIRKLHNDFGVVDPDLKDVKPSDTGVGMRVTLKDKQNQTIACLIIGKPVNPGGKIPLCYVRRPGQDPVYLVEIDTSKLSTKFDDWIEKNLLKLNPLDLKQVHIQDYSMEIVGDEAVPTTRAIITLDYNGFEQNWKLAEDLEFDKEKSKLIGRKMAADEELNTGKLDDLRYALKRSQDRRRETASRPDCHRTCDPPGICLRTCRESSRCRPAGFIWPRILAARRTSSSCSPTREKSACS